MRHLERIGKPDILERKQEEWTKGYIESEAQRPDASKYGNPQILSALNNISHTKCFYCEALLKNQRKEIDHLIEVSVDKSLAFEWTNLYLACNGCNNGRPKETEISHREVLNPFIDSDEEIQANITFREQTIKGKEEKGWKTIQKFKLDDERHDTSRLIHLNRLNRTIRKIMSKKEYSEIGLANIHLINERDKETIKMFASHSEPYSLMCEIFLKENYPKLFE